MKAIFIILGLVLSYPFNSFLLFSQISQVNNSEVNIEFECISGCENLQIIQGKKTTKIQLFVSRNSTNRIKVRLNFQEVDHNKLMAIQLKSLVKRNSNDLNELSGVIHYKKGSLIPFYSSNNSWDKIQYRNHLKSEGYKVITLNTDELVVFLDDQVDYIDLELSDLDEIRSAEIEFSNTVKVNVPHLESEISDCPSEIFVFVDQSGSRFLEKNMNSLRVASIINDLNRFSSIYFIPKVSFVFYSNQIDHVQEFKPGNNNFSSVLNYMADSNLKNSRLTNHSAALKKLEGKNNCLAVFLTDGMPNTIDGVEKEPLNAILQFFDHYENLAVNNEIGFNWGSSQEKQSNSLEKTIIKEISLSEVQQSLSQGQLTESRTGSSFISSFASKCIVDQNSIEYHIALFPNPTTGIFKVLLPENIKPENKISGFIINNEGRAITPTIELTNRETTLNLSNQPDGNYFLVIKLDDNQKLIPFAKFSKP